MRKFAVLGLMLALPVLMATTAGALQVDIITDKTLWSAAIAGSYETETFDDAVLNPGVSFTSEPTGNISNGFYHDVLKSTSAQHPVTTWMFTPQITAFGGYWDLGGGGGSGNSLIVSINDFPYTVGVISSSFNGNFWGFIADTSFTSVTLQGGSGSQQQQYKLDNMVYSFVPVPATVYLFGAGLIGFFGLRRGSRN